MGAPIGNRFWELRAKHGRDRLFSNPQELLEAAYEYFTWCEDHPLIETEQSKNNGKPSKDENGKWVFPQSTVELPRMRAFTMQGICIYLKCNTLYFNQFDASLKDRTDDISKDFSLIITHIREIVYNQKFTGAAAGFLNPNIIARDLGLVEKKELDHSGINNTMKVEIVPSVEE